MNKSNFDAIVVGGGAAGLFCAAQMGKAKKKVLVLEKANKVGRKILMSGGGRCNFTNMYTEPTNFISANPHFCKSALTRYTPWDFIELVSDYQIAYHEKKLGQLFCDNSANDIVQMLLAECAKYQVVIQTKCDIQSCDYNAQYTVFTNQGNYQSEVLVVASGGLSIPSMGVTGFGYELAMQFGMPVLERRAGLVPFTFSDDIKTMATQLSGLSVEVVASNNRASFRESLLFTHRGLSGPAALQLSSYWQSGEAIEVNLLPDLSVKDWLLQKKRQQPKSLLRSLLAEMLPRNLVLQLEARWWPDCAEKPIGEMSNARLDLLALQFNKWKLKPAGTEGYRTAEVTLGGVDTHYLSSKTMESKTHSGLFFIGEVVDVTGHLGGFNFQWAWSSAFICASAT